MMRSKYKRNIIHKFLTELNEHSTETYSLLRKRYGIKKQSMRRITMLKSYMCGKDMNSKPHTRIDTRSNRDSKTLRTMKKVARSEKIIYSDNNNNNIKDDEKAVKNLEMIHHPPDVSSTKHRPRSNSVIDSIKLPPRQNESSTLDIASISKPDWIMPSVDARPNILPKNITNEDVTNKGPIAYLPVPKDADAYYMNHKHRGKCVIFNQEDFEESFDKREGSKIDVIRLQNSFGKLDFDVEVHNDLNYQDIMDEIEDLSQLDHSDNDCLCIIVLTHGLPNDLILAKDVAYNFDKIWKPFTADKCATLAGKPKLFFVQSCRGDKLDDGVVLSSRSLTQSETTDNVTCSYKIPTYADFLIAYSAAAGFCSWRDPAEGTWYIQCLCKVLDEFGTTMDLMNMLTLTARKVALDYSSTNDVDKSMNDKKQVPSVTTMLIRSVYFHPKSKNES